jgi:hypothetical protein
MWILCTFVLYIYGAYSVHRAWNGKKTMIYEKELAALGFSPAEIGAIELALLRMGVIPGCEHTRPRFVECYTMDPAHPELDEMRWQKLMREMGFRDDAITLAEHAIFEDRKRGTA